MTRKWRGGVGWCAAAAMWVLAGSAWARDDSLGLELSVGAWANSGWAAEFGGQGSGLSGRVDLTGSQGLGRAAGYARASLDLEKSLGSWASGWSLRAESQSVGVGQAGTDMAGVATWSTVALERAMQGAIDKAAAGNPSAQIAMAPYQEIIGSAVSQLAQAGSGSAGVTAENTVVGWKLRSESIMAERRFDLGGGLSTSLGMGVSRKKIEALVLIPSVGATSAKAASLQQSESVAKGFTQLAGAVVGAAGGSPESAAWQSRLMAAAGEARAGTLDAGQKAALLADFGAYMGANNLSGATNADMKAGVLTLVQAAAVSNLSKSTPTAEAQSSDGLLPQVSLSGMWEGAGCSCSIRLDVEGIAAPRGALYQYGATARKRLVKSSWGEAGVEGGIKWTDLHWVQASGGADYSFDAKSREVGVGIYFRF